MFGVNDGRGWLVDLKSQQYESGGGWEKAEEMQKLTHKWIEADEGNHQSVISDWFSDKYENMKIEEIELLWDLQ